MDETSATDAPESISSLPNELSLMILENSNTGTIYALSRTNRCLRLLANANRTNLIAITVARERERLETDRQKALFAGFTVEEAFRKYAAHYGLPSRQNITEVPMALQTSNQLFAARYTSANTSVLSEVEVLHDVMLLAHHSIESPFTADQKPEKLLYGVSNSAAGEAIWAAALDGFRNSISCRNLVYNHLPLMGLSDFTKLIERIRTEPISAVPVPPNPYLYANKRFHFGPDHAARALEKGLKLDLISLLPGSPKYFVSTRRGWDIIDTMLRLIIKVGHRKYMGVGEWARLQKTLETNCDPWVEAALLESITVF